MENADSLNLSYKQLIAELLQNNFKSVLMGTFTISLLFSLLYFNISQPSFLANSSITLFENTSAYKMNPVQNISKKIQSSQLPVVNPSSSPSDSLSIAADNQGQISAISTGRVTAKQNKYTVQPGDSISSIALKAYGDINAWPRIAQANNLTNPENIEVGMVLTIPR